MDLSLQKVEPCFRLLATDHFFFLFFYRGLAIQPFDMPALRIAAASQELAIEAFSNNKMPAASLFRALLHELPLFNQFATTHLYTLLYTVVSCEFSLGYIFCQEPPVRDRWHDVVTSCLFLSMSKIHRIFEHCQEYKFLKLSESHPCGHGWILKFEY